MSHSNRKVVRRYYGPPPRMFEEFPEDSDRPTFRADTIELAVLGKLRQFMSNERTKRAIRSEIDRRTKKAVTNASRIESQLADVRSKIARATQNLALAEREDIPGISKLLAGWRETESELNDQLRAINDQHAPSAEAIEIISKLDQLLDRLGEADREKLAFAIRQTVKRISLRRERRGSGRHRITLWDGVIELRDDLGVTGVIPLTDDDIPSPGSWRAVADFIRKRGDVVFFREICEHINRRGSSVSNFLAQAVISGKVRNLGHKEGWIAVK